MPPPRRVLLTNDDGPASPFFIAWVDAVQARLGWPAYVCPPAAGQSFVSKAVSTAGPGNSARSKGSGGGNHATPAGSAAVEVLHVSGSTAHVAGPPATAVNLALYHLAPDCDLVVAGPNIGHNAGRGSLLSSGTVGAAMEAAVAGRRAVALSFPFFHGWGGWTDAELAAAVSASADLVARLWAEWAPNVDVYNVNVPLDHRGRGGGGGGGGGGGRGGGGGDGGSDGSGGRRCRIVLTSVDPGAQYASLYTPAAGLGGENGGGSGGGVAAGSSRFEWGPSGLRVFDAPDPAPGGDVAAIAAGHISVTPLMAGFGHVIGAHEEW